MGSYCTYLSLVKLQPWFQRLQWKTCPLAEHSDDDECKGKVIRITGHEGLRRMWKQGSTTAPKCRNSRKICELTELLSSFFSLIHTLVHPFSNFFPWVPLSKLSEVRTTTAHSAILPSLCLRHCSFSNPSVASPTLLSLQLRHRLFTYVTWPAAHEILYEVNETFLIYELYKYSGTQSNVYVLRKCSSGPKKLCIYWYKTL